MHLVEAQTGQHLWSETYDRDLTPENVFALQEQLAADLAGELVQPLRHHQRGVSGFLPQSVIDHFDRRAAELDVPDEAVIVIIIAAGAALLLAGCSSTEITKRQAYEGDKLPRPDRIIVHDFTANPDKVPAGSSFAGQEADIVTPTPEQREVGQKLGAEIAKNLVADLKGVGLPAVRAEGQPPPQVNDIVLWGYFVSIDEGSATERVVVGFGQGAAEMTAAVEAYQMTAMGSASSAAAR